MGRTVDLAALRKVAHILMWVNFGLLLCVWLRVILTFTGLLPPFGCSDNGMLRTLQIVGPIIIISFVPFVADVLYVRIRQFVRTGKLRADDDSSLFPQVRKGRCLIGGVAAYAVVELISAIICLAK